MVIDALNKLCKWRLIFAGWHLGSKTLTTGGKSTPGVAAMRDLMDKWLIVRAENSALAILLCDKGIFTQEEFYNAIMKEAAQLDKELERVFPGFATSEDGIVISNTKLAHKTMIDKGFPE
jgi:hypothetical protein